MIAPHSKDEAMDNPFAAPTADLGPASAAYRKSPELSELKTANSLARLGAFVIDTGIAVFLFFSVVMVFSLLITFFVSLREMAVPEWLFYDLLQTLGMISAFLMPVVYFAICEGSTKQSTFGKRLFRIRVVDAEGQALSLHRSVLRQFSKLFIFTYGADAIVALFKNRRRALHDYIAGSYVVQLPRKLETESQPNSLESSSE